MRILFAYGFDVGEINYKVCRAETNLLLLSSWTLELSSFQHSAQFMIVSESVWDVVVTFSVSSFLANRNDKNFIFAVSILSPIVFLNFEMTSAYL